MLGHCHPAGDRGDRTRRPKRWRSAPTISTTTSARSLRRRCVDVLPKHLPHVFLANSGAEAMDGALKFARLFTEALGVRRDDQGVSRPDHGRVVGDVGAEVSRRLRPAARDRRTCRSTTPRRSTRPSPIRPRRSILEVVQGESGVNVGTPDFLQDGAARLPRARRAADRRRDPDRLRPHRHDGSRSSTPASSPTSCAWPRASAADSRWARSPTRSAIRDVLTPGAHGSTFGGSPLACAAGLAAIEAYRDEGLIKRSATLGANMRNQLRGALEGVADRPRDPRPRPDDRGRAAHQGGAGAEEPDAESRRDRAAGRTDRPAPAAAAGHHAKKRSTSACRRSRKAHQGTAQA